jgi:lipopolysaccharide biosynthesis glycosyltransferase
MEAIVTVTDEKYILGTQVLFHSFLKHNPKYKGDFVVIHNQLAQNLQAALSNCFTVKFEQVSQELLTKLTELALSCPQFSNKLTRFWSIELFRLRQYHKILFLDSDILCRGNLSDFMKLDDEFVAVADLSHYKGKFRDRTTFEFSNSIHPVNAFQKTFNAGVMLVNESDHQKDIYVQLLNGISEEKFKQLSSGHTDQYILNQHFEHKVTWVDSRYNYILREEKFIKERAGISAQEAKLWHYIRNPKPWNFRRILTKRWRGNRMDESIKEWHLSYQQMSDKYKVTTSFKNRIFLFLSKIFT